MRFLGKLPSASKNMGFKRSDKKLNNEKPGGWLYNDEDGVEDEASYCPCFVYSRSKFRLKEAENKNRNFYGRFISTLRGQVRRFYNIEGSSCTDFWEGCCFPSDTLTQIENEIILRERRKCSDGYKCEPPMSSSSSSTSPGSNSKTTTPDTEHDEPLPCIPEDTSEASATTRSGPSSRRSSRNKRRERSMAEDPVAPTDATLVHNHDLAKDPKAAYRTNKNHSLRDDTSTPTYPPSIHQLRTDTKAPASPPAVHKHDLSHDVTETSTKSKNHDIRFDQVNTFVPQLVESPEHDLHDKTTPGSYPDASHNLYDDMVNQTTRSPRPHTLEADEEVLSRPTNRGPHRLHQDRLNPVN
ncbi:hypothetical protein NW762_011216 [Fusarium torreyae]|uniref:Uncharacterized protein n=1 Tax=Fusarium torreyae TaxID=1237075 RepID=A0A9W8RSA2_9HYPO|nr:hypothetical protein NW762_011216 [Fusarium torreyae]